MSVLAANVEAAPADLLESVPLPPSLVGSVIFNSGVNTCFISDLTKSRPEWVLWKRKAHSFGFAFDVHVESVEAFKERSGAAQGARNATGDSEMQARVVALLAKAAALPTSDVHVFTTPDAGNVQFRIHGELENQTPLDVTITRSMMNAVMNSMVDQGATGNQGNEMQYARLAARFTPPGVAGLRISAAPIVDGRWMNFRLLRDNDDGISGTLAERLTALGFSAQQIEGLSEAVSRTQGMTVIVGTTGHGKSTTLKHVFEAIAHERPGENLVSIEDPVEYRISNVKQQSVNHEGFANADDAFNAHVRFNLRADPDRALIGELRDKETFKLATRFVRTGHPVATTLHTTRWYGVIDRLADELRSPEISDPYAYLLKPEIFSCFVYQRLTKLVCPACGLDAEEHRHLIPDAVQQSLVSLLETNRFSGLRLINPQGCDAEGCRHGVAGRTALAEVVPTTPMLLEVFREHGRAAAVDYWRAELNGQSIFDHAKEKLLAGLVDPLAVTADLGHLDSEIQENAARKRYEEGHKL